MRLRSLCCTAGLLLMTIWFARPAHAYDPTSDYKPRQIEGFTVLVNPELLKHTAASEAAFAELTTQLKAIVRVVPTKPLDALHKVRIWVEWNNKPGGVAEFHPSADWLRENGYNPEKAGNIEISNAVNFVKWSQKEQPWMVLHEMAHSYHFRVLGDPYPPIEQAYRNAMAGKLYDSVAYVNGGRQKAYATTNAKEYFAEISEAYFGKNDFYPFTRLELEQHDPVGYKLLVQVWGPPKVGAFSDDVVVKSHSAFSALHAGQTRKVTPLPQAVMNTLRLKSFYKKYVDDAGFAIVSSEKVSDYALLEAAYLIDQMLAERDDIRQALIQHKVRFAVMAPTEMTTMVPEHSDLTPAKYWDKRARGLGATPERPAVSCGEENLLGYVGDPYRAENILVHEFSHAIHEMGLRFLDKEFDGKLRRAYESALQKGLWKGFYAATNPSEYWAEGVQSWFDCNHNASPFHDVIDTREKLMAYDPDLANLIASVFPNKTWRYVRPEQRRDHAHLQGYDPAQAPHFAWDPELLAWYKNYEAAQLQNKQQKSEQK